MLFIDNEGITDPRINLAIEEYALRHLPADQDYLLFYINEPSIIIGKNQNTFEEINTSYVEEHGIHVVRRLSGGGAVYHDLGNLNFSFITNDDGRSFQQFEKFAEPVVRALRALNVAAEMSGRNDILVEGRKISGNAQFATRGRMFHHGTLLFDSDVEHIVAALQVNEEKIRSKGIRSIRSRVANIKEFLTEPLTIEQFKHQLLVSIFGGEYVPDASTDRFSSQLPQVPRAPHSTQLPQVPRYVLTEEDWRHIRSISVERYANWDWNYGKSPAYDFRQNRRLTNGTFDIRLKIDGGKISHAKIYGDFFSMGDAAVLEEALVGVRHDREAIASALEAYDLKHYIGVDHREEFIDLLLP